MTKRFNEGDIVVYISEFGGSYALKPTYAEVMTDIDVADTNLATIFITVPAYSSEIRIVSANTLHQLTKEQEEDFTMAKLEDRDHMEVHYEG